MLVDLLKIVLFIRQKALTALTGFSWSNFWMVPNLIIFTFYCSMERSASLCNWKSSSLPTCVIYFQIGSIAYQHHCARLHACHQPLSERASICILTHALTKRRANKSCLWHLRNVFSNLSVSRTSWMAVQGLHSPHLHRFSKCNSWQPVLLAAHELFPIPSLLRGSLKVWREFSSETSPLCWI